MTLQQEAVNVIHKVPADSLRSLIDYANFLISRPVSTSNTIASPVSVDKEKAKKPYRSIIGRSKGKVHLSDDFNEIPEGFKEYV